MYSLFPSDYLSVSLRSVDSAGPIGDGERSENMRESRAMADELLRDLPRDLPTFVRRFGSDAKCRAYLVRALWPDGFCCGGCGHGVAWSHKKRLIEECAACGRQHSILAGTIFEQTKTGLSRWFLAIYLVTSSKGGISAIGLCPIPRRDVGRADRELQRQMGFSSYQTAPAPSC